jgi:hypothetical protein
MPLPNPNPVIIPPTPEQDFTDLWLYNIIIHAPSVDSGLIRIETLPYNADNQHIASGNYMVPIVTDQLWNAVNEVPEVEAAMNAIFAAIEPLRAWIDAQQTPVEEIVAPDDAYIEEPEQAPLDEQPSIVVEDSPIEAEVVE